MVKKANPYVSLPNKAFWRRAVASPNPCDVDPVGAFELRLDVKTKVATAGSCFAQHIARHLMSSGFNYYVVEQGHPILPLSIRAKHSYGMFSARYGNIYTSRQLLQLILRAYGQFSPKEDFWIEADDVVLDPYRPTVQPGGFISVEEMHADRAQHLAMVRKMFETLDVFVFTLGLTECWRARSDGAVFPLCPGVEGGVFDPSNHEYFNHGVFDIVEDMSEFIALLRRVNPQAQIVLTVSPVPLMATAEPGAHVLSATTYSKSVLRVAAEMLRKTYRHVHYFPSYEIITGNFSRGKYYADDLRNVVEEGVDHVMRLFLHHASGAAIERVRVADPGARDDIFLESAQNIVDIECDEQALDR